MKAREVPGIHSMALSPGTTLLNGHYRILRQLGRGGFGSVYLAQDTLLGDYVAVKELIPGLVVDELMLKRFLAEARATIRLRHERIVGTHNVFGERGGYFIVMEYLPGGSLEARLAERGALPVGDAISIAVQVCEGLAYAHARGVVHCDLKPANILFAADGGAKVADFGIAHVSEQLVTRTWQTSAGFVAGTIPYMSPEQVDGVRNDPRIDVYALGAVLYRALTGRPYLDFDQRDTPGAQANNVNRLRGQSVTPPSAINLHIPTWLDQIVLKALAKQPEQRFASADQLRAALLQYRPSGGTAPEEPQREQQPTPVKTPPQAQRPLPHWFWPVTAGGAVLFLAIILTVALALGDGHDGKTTVVITNVVPPTSTRRPSPTPAAPTATLVPSPRPATATASPYLFEDDFSDPASGWDVWEDADGSVGYSDGEYQIAVYRADFGIWATPNLDEPLTDFEVEVSARALLGTLDNGIGLLVRYQAGEPSDFYRFQISSDGQYSVGLRQAGEFTTLVAWEASDAIQQGLGATNRMRVVCEGDHFSFYVNGVHLTDAFDDSLDSGSVGLSASSFAEEGTVVRYDELRVQALP